MFFYRRHEEYYQNISNLPKLKLIERTACNLPCYYRTYSISRSYLMSKIQHGIGLIFGDLKETVETEVYTYDFGSLVAEFGGALGLFTGFSFFMLWDMFCFMFHK